MKKILVIIISILVSMFSFVNETSVKFFIGIALPKITIIEKKLPMHLAVLDKGNFSKTIFKYVPEEEHEDIIEDPDNYSEVQKVEDESEQTKFYEVTLDWSTMLKNFTTYKIDVEKLLSENLKFNLSKSGIETIIYHTHTTEAYTPSKDYVYKSSGVYRTLDKNANMLRIGKQIKSELQKYGVGVYHDTSIYDYPDYNSSYSNAGKAIVETINKYKKAKIVLDVHRDAISVNTEQYKPVVKIDGKNVAQFLLVVGTNQGGLKHPGWRENLKLALKIKKLADEKYPGLCRYVILRKERFNQQVSNGAMIVEMGATGNTVEEVLETSKYFSELLVEVCK